MRVLELAQGRLSPTRTYARREWRWVPADPRTATDGRDGTLTILLQCTERRERSKKPVKLDVDHYGVCEEHDPQLPAGVRVFVLLNETPPEAEAEEREELYRCVVGGMAETCSCQAGSFDLRRRDPTSCKHRDALAAMIAEGVL